MSQPAPEPGKKPGMYQRGKQKTMERAAPLVENALGPSERILAGARVESGISRWWILLSTYTLFFRKYFYLTLTEHHVVLLKVSIWTGRPTKVEAAIPRNQVRVGDYRQGVVFGSFRFMIPGRSKPSMMRVHRVFRPEIESIFGQLGVLGPAPGQAPAYGPGPNALPDGTVFGPPGGLPPGQLPPGQPYPPQYAPPGGQDYGPPPGQQYGAPQYGPPPGQQYAPPPGQQYAPPPGE